MLVRDTGPLFKILYLTRGNKKIFLVKKIRLVVDFMIFKM